jgi:FLVCR family feline leukemia virus subgroup C receptor-related protein
MLLQGGFLAFGTNINQLFTPVGFSEVDISILGAGVITMGVAASMVAGIVLNKYHKYLLMTRLAAFGTFILLGTALITYQTRNVTLITVNMIIAAACMVPVIPVSIDFAGELTFP